MDRRSLALLVVLAALWGSSYVFIKIGLDGGVPPATVVFLRTALAALVLVPFVLLRGTLGSVRPLLGWVAVAAVVQVAVPFLLISFAEQWISSSLTGVLIASMPIFTALLAPWVDSSESSGRAAAAGILVGLVGVALVLGVDLRGGGSALVGGLMVVSAGLGYAIGGFVTKRRLSGVGPEVSVMSVMAMSALIVAPVALAAGPGGVPGAGPIAAMVVLGAFATGLAFLIFYRLIASVGPARASLVTYLAPGFAVFYGVALYGEELTAGIVAGLVLIVGGSWLAGRRPTTARVAAGAGVQPAER